MKPLVSVIVPIYNVEKYLPQCIDGIINQTYKNLEIILVDDGSPDNSSNICDEYAKKDKRIVVIHKENGGLSSARNAGLDICNGEYVCFIDSDDLISVSFVDILLRNCINENAEIAECYYVRFTNEDFKQKEAERKVELNSITVTKCTGREMEIKLYEKDYVKHVIVCNKLFNKVIFENIRFPEGKLHEDEFVTYQLFHKCTKVVIVEKELYFYRYNNNSITLNSFNIKRFDALEAYENRLVFYENDNKIYDKLVVFYQEILKMYFFNTKKYLKDNKKYLRLVKDKLKINLKRCKNTDMDKKEYFKNWLLVYFSGLYYLLAVSKDKLLEK